MPSRVQIDIQGTTVTFPINPVDYTSHNSEQYTLQPTIDGAPMRFTPFFDDRKRVMRWRKIPNKEPYITMIANLRSAIGISGVQINHRDLDINGDQNYWKGIRVEDVNYRYNSGGGPPSATSNLSWDLDLVFTYTSQVIL
jgi:hypothetical protein